MKVLAFTGLLAGILLSPPALIQSGGQNPFIDKYLATAEAKLAQGEMAAARHAVERALERDHQHLGALLKLAEICQSLGDRDAAVYAYHRWLDTVDAAEKSPVPRKERSRILEQLELLDETASTFQNITSGYVKELLNLAKDHVKKSRYHTALALYQEILTIDPLNRDAQKAVKQIRRTAGNELATEDLFAGGDPSLGVDPDWIAKEDAKHLEWDKAYTKDGENYRYRTNAGYVVLETSAIAMEQMNGFYRKFFRYKLDGGPTPKIEVRIYKDRDDYLEENHLPENDWTGGFFNGSTVQTFMGGPTGTDSLRQMYGTLFHEAAHQFVSLTGKGGIPGWLNEAYASFFEGCTILSNGSVKWNQVPQHRLFPLAARMEKGWLSSGSEVRPDEEGNWTTPEQAPTFRIVVEGKYRWGPPWYAPTWGVVYFLYNYRNEQGIPVYRDALHEYYQSGPARAVDPIGYFEERILSAPLSPVSTIDELNSIWAEWILELRDIQIGKKEAGKNNLEFGQMALEREDLAMALEFFEEAYEHESENPEVIWKLATTLELMKELDRALAMYRDFARELELRGLIADERYEAAKEKMIALDPLARRHARLKGKVLEDGLELAKSYYDRQMPTMALEITRRMSGQFSMPDALEFYMKVARETGKSLARWKVAYNEFNLDGWSSTSKAYQAYGKMIEGGVAEDPTIATGAGQFQTQELACDVTFDADFSLEAEMRFEPNASLMGLCFGRKDAQNTHAVVLHPKGYLDISTKNGGVWTIRDHRSVKIDSSWQKLRIDVVEDSVDVYLNDRYIRSMKMPSRDSVRGAFGLITGQGTCYYRNIRLLARDPHDPAARIERELAMEALARDEIERDPGTFSGIQPPEIKVGQWIQGESPLLAELRHRIVVLIFWAPYQDKAIPTTAYYEQLAQSYQGLDVSFLALSSNQHTATEIAEYLAEHPMEGIPVGVDQGRQTYLAYNLKAGGWGLPRILLLDVDGTVVWEGDPGFKIGVGWQPEDGETFLDGPLKDLVERRKLREIQAALPALAEAKGSFAQNQIRIALQQIQPLADLDASWHPQVKEAQELRYTIESLGSRLPVQATEALAAGRPLTAEALLNLAEQEFAGTDLASLAKIQKDKLFRDSRYRKAAKAMKSMEKAVKEAERGREVGRILPYLNAALDAAPEIEEVVSMQKAMKTALLEDGSKAMLAVWSELQTPPSVSTDT
ncbi:MAG: DUF1080 domain-containing protein [Planctomycetota bacterium]|nr:MAG: DUF1080 domain-containing protein [Planctomycetota bacterium]